MTREEFDSLIAAFQHCQSELNDVEIKSARAGAPQRISMRRCRHSPTVRVAG